MGKSFAELDTALDESGLFPKELWADAYARTEEQFFVQKDGVSPAEWVELVRKDFRFAADHERHDAAAAVAYEGLRFALSPDAQFELLQLQGIALSALIDAGGPDDLHDFRVAAFENAMLALPDDRGWTHADLVCRIHLAKAWQARGVLKASLDDLEGAREEYAVLLPELERGRWGFATHAKAAEIAVYLAQTEEARAKLGEAADPLPHWLHALALAFDPKLRAEDILGHWDSAADPLEAWIDDISHNSAHRTACSAAAEVLRGLDVPSDNDDYGWVQYHIGALSKDAGLHADGLRMEAQNADDEAELVAAISAYRNALAYIEEDDGVSWHGTAFHLAYALHALGEAGGDSAPLIEAIGLYDQVAHILGPKGGRKEQLQLAQVQTNLSEAMAELAKLQGDADMARKALRIAGDAEMNFTLWAHDEGIEVAQANFAKIMEIIDRIDAGP
jgi:tetratricopeptide (TPR) repeat protein